MAATYSALSLPTSLSIAESKHHQFLRIQSLSLPGPSSVSVSLKNTITLRNPPRRTSRRRSLGRVGAAGEEVLSTEATPLERTQQIVSGGDDVVSTVVSVLLFFAFIGLTILTVGVVYIGVTDFLQKREREKLEKEEEANRKKDGKRKKKMRANAGPRGFGQRINDEEDD